MKPSPLSPESFLMSLPRHPLFAPLPRGSPVVSSGGLFLVHGCTRSPLFLTKPPAWRRGWRTPSSHQIQTVPSSPFSSPRILQEQGHCTPPHLTWMEFSVTPSSSYHQTKGAQGRGCPSKERRWELAQWPGRRPSRVGGEPQRPEILQNKSTGTFPACLRGEWLCKFCPQMDRVRHRERSRSARGVLSPAPPRTSPQFHREAICSETRPN